LQRSPHSCDRCEDQDNTLWAHQLLYHWAKMPENQDHPKVVSCQTDVFGSQLMQTGQLPGEA
jgi:hypothetical protein